MGERQLVASRAGTIRRVVRRGHTFLCGLCRSHYERFALAQGCVEGCWDELLSLDPVIVRRSPTPGARPAYRCRFCARDHASRPKAEACAQECRRKHLDHYEKERSLLDDFGEAPPKRFRPRPALRPVPVPRPAKRPKPAEAASPAAASAPAAPVSVDVVPAAPAATPAPAPAEAAGGDGAEAAAKKPKDPANAFYRDGARYVCKTCNEKYFTKDEVIKCFLGH